VFGLHDHRGLIFFLSRIWAGSAGFGMVFSSFCIKLFVSTYLLHVINVILSPPGFHFCLGVLSIMDDNLLFEIDATYICDGLCRSKVLSFVDIVTEKGKGGEKTRSQGIAGIPSMNQVEKKVTSGRCRTLPGIAD
jgi:hypothetical protein